jgi:hypothetical protein
MVAIDPNVTSQYAIALDGSNNIIIGATQPTSDYTVTTTAYTVGIGALNKNTYNMTGLLATPDKLVLNNSNHAWNFDTDGNLTVPGDIKSAAGVGPVTIQANDGTLRTWTFGGDGNLTIPNGKKIQTTAGSGTSYIQMLTDGPGEINLTVAENSGNTQSTWSFSSVGQLLLPEGGTITYTPATASDWSGAAPTSIQEALDRLAAVVKALNGGTGA